jgi:hypothetical protein
MLLQSEYIREFETTIAEAAATIVNRVRGQRGEVNKYFSVYGFLAKQ